VTRRCCRKSARGLGRAIRRVHTRDGRSTEFLFSSHVVGAPLWGLLGFRVLQSMPISDDCLARRGAGLFGPSSAWNDSRVAATRPLLTTGSKAVGRSGGLGCSLAGPRGRSHRFATLYCPMSYWSRSVSQLWRCRWMHDVRFPSPDFPVRRVPVPGLVCPGMCVCPPPSLSPSSREPVDIRRTCPCHSYPWVGVCV
jgi:hypothetical protein